MTTYAYWNGAAQVHGDPLRIYRRLLSVLPDDANKWLERYENLADDEAREKVTQAAGWALELVPFDQASGSGASESDVEAALRGFLEWLEGEGPRAVSYQTWSRLTAPRSSNSATLPSGSSSTSTYPASSPGKSGP